MANEEQPDWLKDAIKTVQEAPRTAGIDWAMALSFFTLEELNARHPGFKAAVQERAKRTADKMEPDAQADAPSLHEHVESWVFEKK